MISIGPLAIALAGIASAAALPTTSNAVDFPVEERAFADGIVGLVGLIDELVRNDHNAYDTDLEHTCVIHTQTIGGTDCEATIACDGEIGTGEYHGATLEPGGGNGATNTWNACYLNGRQYFYDARVGSFSIEYTQAGGKNSDRDGLHHPVFQFERIGNNAMIHADADANKPGDSGHLCGTREVAGTQRIEYWCGVPQIGYNSFGLASTPNIQPTYATGTCKINWMEYGKDSDTPYRFAARLTDNDGKIIGAIGDSYNQGGERVDASSSPVNFDSALPWVVVVSLLHEMDYNFSSYDDAWVNFAYAAQSWTSNDDNCDTGSYNFDGIRTGSCTFQCT